MKEMKKDTSNRISWNEMFMEIAEVVSERSKDPHTKVGAVIVKDNHILGIGYNAEPKNFRYCFDWTTSEKYDFVIHAEMNAIANATTYAVDIRGSDIYVTLSPCPECMKLLMQYEIKNVYYLDRYEKTFSKTEFMAKYSNLKLICMSYDLKQLYSNRRYKQKHTQLLIGKQIYEHIYTVSSASKHYNISFYTARSYLRKYKASIKENKNEN